MSPVAQGSAIPSKVFDTASHPLDEKKEHVAVEAVRELSSSASSDADTDDDDEDVPDIPAHLAISLSHVSRNLSRRLSQTNSRVPGGDELEPAQKKQQDRPKEFSTVTAEITFIAVCSMSLMMFSFLIGNVTANQQQFRDALGLKNAEIPWINGAFTTANGLSVVISGSITDLMPPKGLLVGSFLGITIWHVVGAFSITPDLKILFFVVRALQGLFVGVLVSGSISILGRVYKPGLRKNRVFSAMAACAPFGFWLGLLQGGGLADHLKWVYGSNAIISGAFCLAAYLSIPNLQPVADKPGQKAVSMRQFDYVGAGLAITGCVCLLFGLTQGAVVHWAPYTLALIGVGAAAIVGLFVAERYVARPMIPTTLWQVKGFMPLMLAYFLGFGTFFGGWQFFAVQFWLRIQGAAPMTVALYFLPNAIVGVLATWIVSRILHLVPGHYIYATSMICFTMGSAFFLPQTPTTSYWALGLPGVALVTFGPDLAFAAASIFITSSVPRSYQGSAGSLLVTNQNLSAAIFTSIAEAIGGRVDAGPEGEIGLTGLRAIWWFALASQLVAALITIIWVRIPKEEEKEHAN